MPPLTSIGSWLALAALAALLVRVNHETCERLQQLCGAIVRHEKGARTLKLVATLPGSIFQAQILWLMASALNERASLRGWRAASGVTDTWHSPFIELAADLRAWKRVILVATQTIVGLAIMAWLTADAHALYAAALALDWPEIILAGRELLATPGFWLWAYLAFAISQSMLPASANARQLLPWAIAAVLSFVIAGISELGAAKLRESLIALHESIARALLGALILQGGFLALLSVGARLRRLIRRLATPQPHHQPESEHYQARH